ncbi:hypothetical protein [Spirosoma montaniterrae]|uniref:Uncharacterized protein n=1 Tax=Spirosoma montaniterrae TaxID=1178516 RepID=A0A1P9WY34_9BACT|nr:hypothetical protein [Spirosoma montaniterrae]AQG80238.1 hypothetical protein AWR27_13470 [Spirosoma montaniterrae]
MWYFLIRHDSVSTAQYQNLQQRASLTEVELFSEPYINWYVFSVEKQHYIAFMNYLDGEGISYDLTADRPSRDDLLAAMR